MNKNVVCFAIDDNYMWPWLVSVYSGVKNSHKSELHVQLLNINCSLSDRNEKLATRIMRLIGVDFEITRIESNFAPTFSNSKSIVVYGPLFALDLLTGPFLWLDADTLLLPDWIEVFKSLGDNYSEKNIIRAVRDTEDTIRLLQLRDSQSFVKSKIRYFNSGVMICHPQNWQNDITSFKWKEIAYKRDELNFMFNDQDILNYLVGENVSLISDEYNQISIDRNVNDKPRVLHFAGTPKPWNMSLRAKQIYLAYYGLKFQNSFHFSRIQDVQLYWSYESEVSSLIQKTDPDLWDELTSITKKKELDLVARLKLAMLRLLSGRLRNG